MKQRFRSILTRFTKFCRRHKRSIVSLFGIGIVSLVLLILVCNHIVGSYRKYVLPAGDTRHVTVGLVLGAGITKDGKPFKELQARLDVAAEALQNGRVDKLILSGDNRYPNYDEPEAMKQYLVNVRQITSAKLQPDYAGRSTYESCERASKVFGLQETIIFSASSHLPRAIFLCRQFGIKAYGISSNVEANNSRRRELLARVKAVFNVYVHGENTLLGPKIQF